MGSIEPTCVPPGSPPVLPHLRASALACGLLAVLALASLRLQDWLLGRRLVEFVETPLPLKNQGEVVQRLAWSQPDVLPVYGSSEMGVVVRARPDEFFHSMPSGFRVCPVGAPGSTSFLLAQKIASVGDAARGKKIAVVLSATWFCREGVPDDSYAGNFSPLQAGSFLLGDELDPDLRRRFLARMREFPETLASRPVMRTYVRHAAEEGAWSAAVCAFVRPLLWLSRAELALEDRFAVLSAAVHFDGVRPPHAGTHPSGADFNRLIARVEEAESPQPGRDLRTREMDDDARFVRDMNASREWGDFELLLDTLRHLDMKVLILSVPLPGRHFDERAISREARDNFYERLEKMCAERGIPCRDFSDHERDEGFTIPHSSHFTEKGWLYVDRVLDDFYHDRLPVPTMKASASR